MDELAIHPGANEALSRETIQYIPKFTLLRRDHGS